jgi:hypothetical protein
MSSAADTLRRAAEVLRERAEAATPGPWEPYVLGSEGYDVRGPQTSIPGRRIARSTRVARCGYEEWEVDKANAAYIATVDPTVGLALADWLDSEAINYAANKKIWGRSSLEPENRWAERGLTVEANLEHHHAHALAVARAILRDQP